MKANNAILQTDGWKKLEELCWLGIREELPEIKRGDLVAVAAAVDQPRHPRAFAAVDLLQYAQKLADLGKDPESDKYVGLEDELLSMYAGDFASIWWREPAALALSLVNEENLKKILKEHPWSSFERFLVVKANVLRLDLRTQEAEELLKPLFTDLLEKRDSAYVNAGWLLAEIQFERDATIEARLTLQTMIDAMRGDDAMDNIIRETQRRMNPAAKV